MSAMITTATGTYRGMRLTCMSTGMGTDNVEIVLAEVMEITEAPTFIRIGSSGALQPEIAQAMLQRQQASAIIAAREKIVDGAVGMVDSALRQLERQDIVQLDDERKAAMVSNLLVVLCSERGTTPVVNTGSLYT